jgi:hypothetical protein
MLNWTERLAVRFEWSAVARLLRDRVPELESEESHPDPLEEITAFAQT